MRAIELSSKTDNSGLLKIDYKIGKSNSPVRILILIDDELIDSVEEKQWMNYISNNPAFSFLNEPGEDIYSLTDGEAIND